jgi:hypothetical protein
MTAELTAHQRVSQTDVQSDVQKVERRGPQMDGQRVTASVEMTAELTAHQRVSQTDVQSDVQKVERRGPQMDGQRVTVSVDRSVEVWVEEWGSW